MFKNVVLIAILLFLHTGAAQAADYTDSVVQDGDTREFQVHIPDSVAGQKNLPVVIVLHGGGGTAKGVRAQTGMDAVADKNGFITVYPEGTEGMIGNFRTWNAGHCCGTAARKNIDDVAFISSMIDALVKKYAIDSKRVYATGHSNGAMMSYRLACELSDKIAAIAPNSGQRVFDNCHPKRPVAIMHIHGTADPCALYNGGAECGGCFSQMLGFSLPDDKWACPPVKDIVKEHALMNGCSAETKTVFTKGAVTCKQYQGCPANAVVELCSIEGEGHRWPGTDDVGPAVCKDDPSKRSCLKYTGIVGPANHDINGGEFMWNFFKNYHLP